MMCFALDFHLGQLEEAPGQWIEGRVDDYGDSFTIEADLGCRLANGDLSLIRVGAYHPQPFKAELFSEILSLLARPPFEPTDRTLRLGVDVAGDSASSEALRIAKFDNFDPGVTISGSRAYFDILRQIKLAKKNRMFFRALPQL